MAQKRSPKVRIDLQLSSEDSKQLSILAKQRKQTKSEYIHHLVQKAVLRAKVLAEEDARFKQRLDEAIAAMDRVDEVRAVSIL